MRDAGTFIVDHFYGYYYTKPVLRWLDQVWANIQKLHGYKKDLALAALGTTVKAKSAFGQFSRSKMHRRADLDTDASLEQSQLSNPPLSKFIESFRRSVGQLNRLVFDNGKECKAFNLDAAEASGASARTFCIWTRPTSPSSAATITRTPYISSRVS